MSEEGEISNQGKKQIKIEISSLPAPTPTPPTSSLRYSINKSKSLGRLQEVPRIPFPSKEEFFQKIRPQCRPFIFDCSKAFEQIFERWNSTSHTQSGSAFSSATSLSSSPTLLELLSRDDLLGSMPIKVRVKYQQRLIEKVEGYESTFGKFVEEMKDRDLKSSTTSTTTTTSTLPTTSSSSEQTTTSITSTTSTTSSSPPQTPYAANLPVDPKYYNNIGLPWPPFYEEGGKSWKPRIWMGCKGSGTPLHCDSRDNFALQIVGEKKWWIIPPYHAAEASYTKFRDRYYRYKIQTESDKKSAEQQNGTFNSNKPEGDEKKSEERQKNSESKMRIDGSVPLKDSELWEEDKGIGEAPLPSHSALPDIRKTVKESGSYSFINKDDSKQNIDVDIIVITVKPMEMLYLPVYTGHAIDNLSMSFMINFWEKNLPGLLGP